MLTNTNYINWLANFTSKYPNFTDDDWASENNINPVECDFGNFYKIKLGNAGFLLGYIIGQGTIYFCNRVQLENLDDFIDFKDIINTKKDNEVIKTEINKTKVLKGN